MNGHGGGAHLDDGRTEGVDAPRQQLLARVAVAELAEEAPAPAPDGAARAQGERVRAARRDALHAHLLEGRQGPWDGDRSLVAEAEGALAAEAARVDRARAAEEERVEVARGDLDDGAAGGQDHGGGRRHALTPLDAVAEVARPDLALLDERRVAMGLDRSPVVDLEHVACARSPLLVPRGHGDGWRPEVLGDGGVERGAR